MPLLLQREYSFPFLEGRIFVDRLRESGGWDSVNDAWGRLPESTEQILHPKLYPNDRPTTVVMDGIAGRLGDGWKEGWQQTMGELRIGVWLADGQPGEQYGPEGSRSSCPRPMPRPAGVATASSASTAPMVSGPSCGRPSGTRPQDVGQFVKAANAVVATCRAPVSWSPPTSRAASPTRRWCSLTSDDDTLGCGRRGAGSR